MPRLVVVLLLGGLASGCSVATRAQAPVERPPLEVPPVPPRVIDPAPAPEVAVIEPVSDLPPPAADPKPPRRTPRETAATARETQKPEPKPDAAPPADSPPANAAQNTPPAPLLRTPATADAAAVERQIKETLQRAQNGLNTVNYQRLSAERQKAYNEAKDFITGAEAAVKSSNFELAKEFADKADRLVKVLQGG